MKTIVTTKSIREASRALFIQIESNGNLAVRALGNLISLSKSSAFRLKKAFARRNKYPESAFWETQNGYAWLRLMELAVLYTFGLQHHVGAEALSDFFKLIRIDDHVGVSSNAIRNQLSEMKKLLPAFQKQCESSAPEETRKAVLAADETFFGQILILVLMDLSSGYLVLESIQNDRTFDTWFTQSEPRLKALGIEVNHAVSDRAKALIKLAIDGFECKSGADLFHEQYGLSRWLSGVFGRRKAKAEQQYEKAENDLKTKPSDMSDTKIVTLEEQLEDAKKAREHVERSQQEYRDQLQGIADEVHPFSLDETIRTTDVGVASGLEKRVQAIETLAKREDIPDTRSALPKFRAQIAALSCHIGVWWLWVESALLELSVDIPTQQWLIGRLLPVLYWHHQMDKTKNSIQRKRYEKAWQRAGRELEADPFGLGLSTSELERWLEWGEWMVRQFHRSSSAVEGRNGRLSQMYRNGRGLTKNRLEALTVIHNYGLRRSDGTTAAERLFGVHFPNLFDWLVSQMGELPLPRKARQRVEHKPLILLSVPA